MKKLTTLFISFGMFVVFSAHASAHVVVRPAEVGIGSFQTFTVGVPNERDNPTVGVRIVVPEGVEHVSPNVKPGWNIQMTRGGEGDLNEGHSDGQVMEISWSEGNIPEGQRDDFFFSAKVPSEETELVWKAYQTYSDGTVVSWEITSDDMQPEDEEGNPDYSEFGPASYTKVINDLEEGVGVQENGIATARQASGSLPLTLSVVAIILSGGAIAMQLRKKK